MIEGYTDVLRKAADLMDAHPELQAPSTFAPSLIEWNFWGEDVKERMAAHRKAIGGVWRKNAPEVNGYDDKYYNLTSEWNGVTVKLCAYRESVCEAVVVGTEKVVKQVPIAFEDEEVEQDVIEWRCSALLDAATSVSEK